MSAVEVYAARLDAEADRVKAPPWYWRGRAYNEAVATGLIAAARFLREWDDDASLPDEPPPARIWAMPEIPADVTRLTAVGGDVLIQREGDSEYWMCVSKASGNILGSYRTRELIARYAPLIEAVGDRG